MLGDSLKVQYAYQIILNIKKIQLIYSSDKNTDKNNERG